MKRLMKVKYWPPLIGLILLLLFFLHSRYEVKKIDLDSIPDGNTIVFEISSISLTEKGYLVEGICYDTSNILEFDNWISGRGYNIYNNFSVILYDDHNAWSFETFSTYDALVVNETADEIDYSFYGFEVYIPVQYSGNLLGVVSKDENGLETKKLTELRLEDGQD